MDKIDELLTRGVTNIIPGKDDLKKQLHSDKKLNVYLGIDPTAPHIHLGHAVALRKLQILAELGHNVTLLIGDFTALVGDTSDKESERPILTEEEISANFQTYKTQAEKLLDFSKIKIKRNSEWLEKLTIKDVITIARRYSLNDFISRELIKKRLDDGKHVRLDETIYPLMQGYDSYFMDTDIQLGAADQTFNMQAGRILQKVLRNKDSYILVNDYLSGTDGRKMSKSWGNAIWLDDQPNDIYAKVMAIKDDLIIQYYTLATNVSREEITHIEDNLDKGTHPMPIKKKLAQHIVSELYGQDESKKAAENFEKVVQKDELPDEIPQYNIKNASQTIIEVLIGTKLISSKSDAKRLIEQGGLEINSKKVNDVHSKLELYIENGAAIIQVGKRRFVKVKLEA